MASILIIIIIITQSQIIITRTKKRTSPSQACKALPLPKLRSPANRTQRLLQLEVTQLYHPPTIRQSPLKILKLLRVTMEARLPTRAPLTMAANTLAKVNRRLRLQVSLISRVNSIFLTLFELQLRKMLPLVSYPLVRLQPLAPQRPIQRKAKTKNWKQQFCFCIQSGWISKNKCRNIFYYCPLNDYYFNFPIYQISLFQILDTRPFTCFHLLQFIFLNFLNIF